MAIIRRAATMASPLPRHDGFIPYLAHHCTPSYNILTIWNLSTRPFELALTAKQEAVAGDPAAQWLLGSLYLVWGMVLGGQEAGEESTPWPAGAAHARDARTS